ncbi:MAG: MarR family transcriptional regulator [Candidatus Omnitrophota bacterium]
MNKNASLKDFARKVMEVLPLVMRGFLRTQTDALAKGKISAPQYLVLDLIVKQGAMKMTRLADELAVSLPAMSGLVDRLYKIKLIKRIYPEKDRRVITIDVTPKGKNIVHVLQIQREKKFQEIFEQLDEKDRKDYLRVIMKIKEILSNSKTNANQG